MKKLVALLLSAVLVVSSAFALSSCGETETDRTVVIENNVIKIGLISPITGGGAQYGQAVKEAVELAMNEINASNDLLKGYTIQLVVLDDQTDATIGAQNFSTLEAQGIAALMGPVTTGVTNAVTPLANDYQVVMLTPTATGNNITTEDDYVFRSCFKDAFQGTLAADYAADNGYTEVGVVYAVGDDYSKGLYEAFTAECAKRGVTVKVTETSPTIDNETDFTTQMTSIKASLGAEGFLFAPYYYSAVGTLIVPQARAAGFNGVIMGSDGYDGVLGSTVGTDMSIYNNVIYTNHYDADSTDTKVVNFISAYKAAYDDKAPTAFAALAYDGFYMLMTGVQNAIKVDGDKVTVSGSDVQKAMSGMSYVGVTGTFQLDETGTPEKSAVIMEFYAYGEDNKYLGMRSQQKGN